ncbi:MAG: radical SAM protein [Theionarchaea archaeon]|nr:radical SAM protein [Theionarchaea archaeon]
MYPYVDDAVLYDTDLGPRVFLAQDNRKLKINKNVKEILSICDGVHEEKEVINAIKDGMGVSPEEAQESYRKTSSIFSDRGILKFRKTPRVYPVKTRPNILDPPFEMAYAELTYRCNLACKHCYNAAGGTHELSTEEWIKIIDEIYRCGCLRLFITGGEPLLYDGFFDIVLHARRKPLAVGVLTNGTLLDETMVGRMKDMGVNGLHFSVDGPNNYIHDEFRGVEKSFEKTLNAIRITLNSGLRASVTLCIHRNNLREGQNLVNLMETMGVTEYTFTPVIKSFREEECAITPEEYKEFIDGLPKKEKTVYAPQYVRNCGIGFKECVIHPDGTVGLCPPFGVEGPVFGDLKKDSFDIIWESPILKRLRSIDAFRDEKCGTCPHVRYCLGGCMAQMYYINGVITCGNPYRCSYYSMLSHVDVIELKETL